MSIGDLQPLARSCKWLVCFDLAILPQDDRRAWMFRLTLHGAVKTVNRLCLDDDLQENDMRLFDDLRAGRINLNKTPGPRIWHNELSSVPSYSAFTTSGWFKGDMETLMVNLSQPEQSIPTKRRLRAVNECVMCQVDFIYHSPGRVANPLYLAELWERLF